MISACCLSAKADCIYIGTDSGNIHVLSMDTFATIGDTFGQESIISW
jgi:hypothetical protein